MIRVSVGAKPRKRTQQMGGTAENRNKRHDFRWGHRCGTSSKMSGKAIGQRSKQGGGRKALSGCGEAQPTPFPPGRRQPERAEHPWLVAQSSPPREPPKGLGEAFGDRRHSGETPLHCGAFFGLSELVPVLLAAGPGAQSFSTIALSPTHSVTVPLQRAVRIRSTFSTAISTVRATTVFGQCLPTCFPAAGRQFSTVVAFAPKGLLFQRGP